MLHTFSIWVSYGENLWMKLIKLGIRRSIFDIIKSIYTNIKSSVKYMKQLSDSFECLLGVRQGECLSPFLFSMFINDIEDMFIKNGNNGIDMYMFKMFLMLYTLLNYNLNLICCMITVRDRNYLLTLLRQKL